MAPTEMDGVLEDCLVRDIVITKTHIRKCTLKYAVLYTSKISNSKPYNCKIFSSKIEASELYNSNLHETEFEKSKLNGCKISKSPLAFRKFPHEIRNMIFRHSVSFENRKTPAVLIALRGDKELYDEAIRLFYKLNFFTLNYYMLDRCSKISLKALSNISEFTVDCREQEMRYIDTAAIPEPIIEHSKIMDLHIHGIFKYSIYNWLEESLAQLHTIKKLIIEVESNRSEPVSGFPSISIRFGVKAKKLGQNMWVWNAKEGKTLQLEAPEVTGRPI